MKNKKIILFTLSLMLIVIPLVINIYSKYKLFVLTLGIVLLVICLVMDRKVNLFIIFLLIALLIISTYGIDYLKVYTLNISPVYILENNINDDVSIYNSLFYRIYKCNNEYILDNNYKQHFACEMELLEEIDINQLLNAPITSYENYKNDFIKVTGKISKIEGTSYIYLQEYISENQFNGYVKFNETSKLKVNVKNLDISNYRIYDYITIVGLLESYDEEKKELLLTEAKINEKNLYKTYDIHVIESASCDNSLTEYIDNYYTYCLENIYVDYKVDKYELSYVLKDKKILFDDLIRASEVVTKEDITLYKLEKFNILACSKNKNILINKNIKIDYSLCEE